MIKAQKQTQVNPTDETTKEQNSEKNHVKTRHALSPPNNNRKKQNNYVQTRSTLSLSIK